MDRGAWWALVPGVAKIQTWLSTHTHVCVHFFILKDFPSEGKRRGNQIQEVCGLALLPELRLSRFSINISGKNGTKMWVRPHEDMHGPRKDLSLCSNSWPLSWWCHPTISSSIIPLLLPPSISPSIRVFFQWVGSLHQVARVLELQHQSFQWIFRVAFL